MGFCGECGRKLSETNRYFFNNRYYCFECYSIVKSTRKVAEAVCSKCGRKLFRYGEKLCSLCREKEKEAKTEILARRREMEEARIKEARKALEERTKEMIKAEERIIAERVGREGIRCSRCGKPALAPGLCSDCRAKEMMKAEERIKEARKALEERTKEMIKAEERIIAERRREEVIIPTVSLERRAEFEVVVFCPMCKERNKASSMRCSACGAPLGEEIGPDALSAVIRTALPVSVSQGQSKIKVIFGVMNTTEIVANGVTPSVSISDSGGKAVEFSISPESINIAPKDSKDFTIIFDVPEDTPIGNLITKFKASGSIKGYQVSTSQLSSQTIVQYPPNIEYVNNSFSPIEVNTEEECEFSLIIKNKGEASVLLSPLSNLKITDNENTIMTNAVSQLRVEAEEIELRFEKVKVNLKSGEWYPLIIFIGVDSNGKEFGQTLRLPEPIKVV